MEVRYYDHNGHRVETEEDAEEGGIIVTRDGDVWTAEFTQFYFPDGEMKLTLKGVGTSFDMMATMLVVAEREFSAGETRR